MLVRQARILILDEPTAVLMPQEIAGLMVTLRQLARQGFSIFIVTHKIAEAMQVSDRVSVMRAGHMVGTWNTSDTKPDALITHMIGHGRNMHLERRDMPPGQPILYLRGLTQLAIAALMRCAASISRCSRVKFWGSPASRATASASWRRRS